MKEKILVISDIIDHKITYYNTFIYYSIANKNCLHMNFREQDIKSFCDKNSFVPDVIIIDFKFMNNFVLGTRGRVPFFKNLHFFNSKVIFHSHKDMFPHVQESVKRFCGKNKIKNLFYINAYTKVDNKGMPLNEKICLKEQYSDLNSHPIEYSFEPLMFELLKGKSYKNFTKEYDIGFSGVMNNQVPEREKFFNKIKNLDSLKYNFLFNKRFKTVKEYSENMLKTNLWIDTPTMGSHISARLWELPYHGSVIVVPEHYAFNNVLKDGVNSIVIKNDESFVEKIKYYISDSTKLDTLRKNAYKMFMKNHTSEERIKYMIKKSK